MRIGSEEHKQLFCQQFLDSYQDYDPDTLPFPDLSEADLAKLRGIPFWEEALSVESEAGVMVSAFAETIEDPLIKQAIALQGREEHRHAKLLRVLIQRYGIEVKERPAPVVPAKIEQAFMDFGFGECLDSYFAFGMFGLARQARYMPEPLFTIFDPILHEEARHIVFFVNWVTYLQIQRGQGLRLLRGGHALWHYGRAILTLVKAFGSAPDGSGEVFTATGAKTFMDDLTLEQFLAVTLEENANRMKKFDDRLLQPMLLPRLSAIALRVVRLLPGRSTPTPAPIQASEP